MGLLKGSGMREDCDKAAQILKSFTKKGKIPAEAIANAKGIAIFNGFRAGMYFAGNGGSGVVVARLPDGSWSPPSAFSVRSGSFGLVYGVDVYDCICILNTAEAVAAYTNPEVNMGAQAELAAGPKSVSSEQGKRGEKPVWVYTKSRGLYGGVTVDGTVIKEKADTNADFYGRKVSCKEILGGEVAMQDGAAKLIEIFKLSEGKAADSKVVQEVSDEPTMGDMKE